VSLQSRLEAEARRRANLASRLADSFAAGRVGSEQFADEFYEILLGGHAEAWGLGRALAGDPSSDPFDLIHGRAKADRETAFIARFAGQLDAGWATGEDGSVDAEKIARRMRLYVGKLRATGAEAFVETSADAEEFDWVLGAVEEHCNDCPRIARLSPFLKDELFQYPGDGETPCLSNCKCHLVRASDGVASFAPFAL